MLYLGIKFCDLFTFLQTRQQQSGQRLVEATFDLIAAVARTLRFSQKALYKFRYLNTFTFILCCGLHTASKTASRVLTQMVDNFTKVVDMLS